MYMMWYVSHNISFEPFFYQSCSTYFTRVISFTAFLLQTNDKQPYRRVQTQDEGSNKG